WENLLLQDYSEAMLVLIRKLTDNREEDIYMAEEVKSTAKATAKQVRIAPRKARLVVDLIRGKDVGEATAILRHTQRAASPVVEKVLNSAIANAEHSYEMNPDELYVSSVYVDEGITLKRFRPRAQG